LIAADAVRHRELIAVCADLRSAHLSPLLLKGAGLAYLIYRHSWHRPQDDLDLWCRLEDAAAVAAVLRQRGYTASHESRPEETGQQHFLRRAGGVQHQVEIHTRLLTPSAFADALPFDEGFARAIPVAELGGALTLAPVHALLLACLHRVAHHFDAPRLIWLYDIHLLAGRLGPSDWHELVAVAARAEVRAVTWSGLHAAAAAFGTRLPGAVQHALDVPLHEASAVFLGSRITEFGVQWSNFRHASWRRRATLLRWRFFPPATFMFERYGACRTAWLPWLYARRIAIGLPHLFRRYGAGSTA
jgi:hypothetical protein